MAVQQKNIRSILYFASGVSPDAKSLRDSEAKSIISELTDSEFEARVAVQKLDSGPGSESGAMFAVTNDDQLCEGFGYYPQKQEWTRSTGGIWVCLQADAPILPGDLERRRCPVTEFGRVRMEDGSIWECPVLRDPTIYTTEGESFSPFPADHTTTLPQTHFQRVEDDGQVERVLEVNKSYTGLFDQSGRWFDWLMSYEFSDEKIQFGYPELYDYCLQVLSLKYRFTQHLQNAVRSRFICNDQVRQILSVSCGWDLALRHLQKKSCQPIVEEQNSDSG